MPTHSVCYFFLPVVHWSNTILSAKGDLILLPLIIAAIEDDSDRAFMERVYYRYQRFMYKTICTLISNPWDADDIFQTTLPNLIDHLDTLKSLSEEKLTAYIGATCRNTAISFLRKKGRLNEFSFEEFQETPFVEEDPCQLFLNEDEDVAALHRAWDKLDARSQYLLEARYLLNKSYDEIALDINIKPASARVAMNRTREKAKRLILAERAAE